MSGNPPKIQHKKPLTYRTLLGEAQWQKLHPAIRKRFSPVACDKAVVYEGVMHEVKLSFAGKLLAQACRIIGTPLALYAGKDVPTTVRVYPNEKLKGMTWDRFYHYPDKPCNRVRSTKCIREDCGLMELVGMGFGMQLKLYEHESALCFESTRFFCQAGKFRIPIPDLITPGKTVVVQKALGDEIFEFSLHVTHQWLGTVFEQIGTFKEGT